MATNDKLVSTVTAGSSPAIATLVSSAEGAAANSVILQSEIQSSLSTLLGSLASNAVISEKDPLKQLSEASPAVNEFIMELQKSIFNYKAATPQGLLLKNQLDSGNITAEQFASEVGDIAATADQAQAAVAGVIMGETQKLLLTLSSDKELKVVETAISNASVVTPAAQTSLVEVVTETTPAAKAIVKSLKTDTLLTGDEVTLGHLPDTNDKSKGTDYQTDAEIATSNITTIKADHSVNNDTLLNQKVPKGGPSEYLPDTANHKLGTEIQTDEKLIHLISPESFANKLALAAIYTDEKLGFFRDMVKLAKEVAERNLKTSLSSLLTLNPQPKIMSGARAVVKINGLVAALCVNVSYEITTDWTEIKGIDEMIPNDLVPNSYSIKGTMSLYRVPGSSPVDMYLQQDMFRGIIWPYSTIEIRDIRTDELILLVNRAAITNRSESYVKGQLTTTVLSFIGMGFRDESMPKLLPDQLRSILFNF